MNGRRSIFLMLLLAGCTNVTSKGSLNSLNPGSVTFLGNNPTSYTHLITNNVSIVALAASGASGNADYQLSLPLDTSQPSYQSLTNFCGGTNNPCACELDWYETSTTGSTSVPYQRTKRIPIVATDVQSGSAKCTVPYGVWSQIANGTTVTLNIIPIAPNATGLNVRSVNYKVGTSVAASGDFFDSTLTPFRNIMRYSCYSKTAASFQILNQYFQSQTSPAPATGDASTVNVYAGSKFCTGAANTGGSSASGGGSTSGQCNTPRSGWSAQSYYRTLYIRSDLIGQMNSTNAEYDCPQVQASINESAAGDNVPAQNKGKFWPMDTTFALATTYSAEWSVGLRAASVLFKNNSDPNSQQDLCSPQPGPDSTSTRLTEIGTVQKCLGYAKPTNSDGTCGTITDNNGKVRPLVRVRRYRAIFPPIFQSNGDVSATNPAADEVYVADRLVVNSAGISTGSMIYGPKPCNYAWFDHEGVVTRDGTVPFKSDLIGDPFSVAYCGSGTCYATPGYVATSNYYYQDYRRNRMAGLLSGPLNRYYSVNPDGLVFPNQDIGNSDSLGQAASPSCSATLPVVGYQMGSPNVLQLLTVNQYRGDSITLGSRTIYLNEVHVQPTDPWLPTWVEDSSFAACAPLSDPYLEPPLHFTRSGNSMDWCAEAYPTQNPYWADLNTVRKPTGSGTANIVNYPASLPAITTAPVQVWTSHFNSPTNPNGAVNLLSSDPNLRDYNHYLDPLNSCAGDSGTFLCTLTGGTSMGGAGFCAAYLNKTSSTTTCDRTVLYQATQQYRGFPLLAPDTDIEDMMAKDLASGHPNYSCRYSVNTDPNKVGTAMPSSACCGMISGTPLLKNLINASGTNPSGHLEPYKNSAAPANRFCGYPVE